MCISRAFLQMAAGRRRGLRWRAEERQSEWQPHRLNLDFRVAPQHYPKAKTSRLPRSMLRLKYDLVTCRPAALSHDQQVDRITAKEQARARASLILPKYGYSASAIPATATPSAMTGDPSSSPVYPPMTAARGGELLIEDETPTSPPPSRGFRRTNSQQSLEDPRQAQLRLANNVDLRYHRPGSGH